MKLAPKIRPKRVGLRKKIGVKEFIPRKRYELTDDHLPLNQDREDPDLRCDRLRLSALAQAQRHTRVLFRDSLAKVARVMLHWLQDPPVPAR